MSTRHTVIRGIRPVLVLRQTEQSDLTCRQGVAHPHIAILLHGGNGRRLKSTSLLCVGDTDVTLLYRSGEMTNPYK